MSQLEALCTSCARCCNGTLFGATLLGPAEAAELGGPMLPQPCPKLGGDLRCTVYATRPGACSRYLCPPAAALERGELELGEARQQVQSLSRG